MRILYLDTSSSFLYTAILEDDEVIVEIKEKLDQHMKKPHFAKLGEYMKKFSFKPMAL